MGKTLGVIGLGAIGIAVANAAHALGMKVVGCDPFLSTANALKLDPTVKVVATRDELYAAADYITVHTPLNADTKGMFNAQTFAKLKDGAVLINNSRGELIEESAVIEALESGKLARYITDFPNAQLIATPSTAESVKNLISADVAAIAGTQCAGDGLELSDTTIADEPNNFTSFLLVKRGAPSKEQKSNKVFFSATCLHESGTLVSLLSVLANEGINMTKIESRPIKNKDGEFRFFIEIEGDYSSKKMQQTFNLLRAKSTSIKILGCY